MHQDNYQILIDKLDQFIRKYYVNQLIRGALYTLATVVFLFVLINVLEYFYYFNTSVRKLMFYGFFGYVFGILVLLGHFAFDSLFPIGESYFTRPSSDDYREPF